MQPWICAKMEPSVQLLRRNPTPNDAHETGACPASTVAAAEPTLSRAKLAGKDFAYDGEKSLFTIVLEDVVSNRGICLLVRQSFFHNDLKNFVDVGGGVLGCRGFNSTFRTTQGGLSLNIDGKGSNISPTVVTMVLTHLLRKLSEKPCKEYDKTKGENVSDRETLLQQQAWSSVFVTLPTAVCIHSPRLTVEIVMIKASKSVVVHVPFVRYEDSVTLRELEACDAGLGLPVTRRDLRSLWLEMEEH
ncbi:hypothetical protein RHSIM_Rhsim02G0069100 [Rhododendron simsii]|uniref:Argonaute linker 1 domain-containing protein n=1 Tax=Rhododendron simsii TaxID=118357 RepID=A0A834HBP1_RHOSS|nr:hypothetical protein RHSIM_Rhsim02G0069100 [Rhododendron simsii]